MTQESVPCEVTSNTSHILPSISDKFNTDEKIGDIDSDNISNDDSDQENSQIDTLIVLLHAHCLLLNMHALPIHRQMLT